MRKHKALAFSKELGGRTWPSAKMFREGKSLVEGYSKKSWSGIEMEAGVE